MEGFLHLMADLGLGGKCRHVVDNIVFITKIVFGNKIVFMDKIIFLPERGERRRVVDKIVFICKIVFGNKIVFIDKIIFIPEQLSRTRSSSTVGYRSIMCYCVCRHLVHGWLVFRLGAVLLRTVGTLVGFGGSLRPLVVAFGTVLLR